MSDFNLANKACCQYKLWIVILAVSIAGQGID